LDEKLQELTQLKENFSKIEKELIQTKEGQISYLTDEQKELIKASQKLQEYTESLEIKLSKKLNELVSKIKEGLNKTKLLLNIDIPSNVNTIHQFIDKIYTYNVQLQINTNNTQFAEQFKSYKKPGNYPLTIEINLGTSSNKMCSNDVLIMQSYLYKHLTPEIKCKLKYDEDNTEQNNTLEENYSICIYIKNNIYTGEKFVMKKLDKYGKFVDFTESENYDEKYFFSNFKNAYKLLIKEGFNPVSGGAVSKQKRLLPNKTFEYNKTTTNKYFEYIQNLVMPIYMMKFIKFYFYKHNKNDKTSQIKDYILNLIVIIGLNVIKQIDLSNALTIDFILTHISYNINKKEESFLIPYFLLYLINI
jgi:branched-subunit amino acid transport protein AzlD